MTRFKTEAQVSARFQPHKLASPGRVWRTRSQLNHSQTVQEQDKYSWRPSQNLVLARSLQAKVTVSAHLPRKRMCTFISGFIDFFNIFISLLYKIDS